VDVDGRAGYTLGDVAPGRGLRLLPVFDNYLVGYRERDLLIDAADRPHVYAGGIIRPTVLLDGRVIGTLRLARSTTVATVEVTAFRDLTRTVASAIEAEVDDIARFVALPTTLTFATPPS